MPRGQFCRNCRKAITPGATTGESSVYSPERKFLLCEPCWLDEDADIDDSGGNVMPDRVARYEQNERLGPCR